MGGGGKRRSKLRSAITRGACGRKRSLSLLAPSALPFKKSFVVVTAITIIAAHLRWQRPFFFLLPALFSPSNPISQAWRLCLRTSHPISCLFSIASLCVLAWVLSKPMDYARLLSLSLFQWPPPPPPPPPLHSGEGLEDALIKGINYSSTLH